MTTSYNDELKRLKKGGKPNSIYYLSANLPYLEKQIVETIATFAGDRNSIVTLDIMNTETTELEEILCSSSLLSGSTIVRIVNSSKLLGDHAKIVVQIIDNMIDGNVVIVVEPKIPKNSIVGKYLMKSAHVLSKTGINDTILRSWINKRFKVKNCSISREASNLLIEYTLGDMPRLSMEIDKLISYSGGNINIEPKHISEIISKDSTLKIFQVLDALADNKTTEGIRLIHKLVGEGEPPERTLAMINNHFQRILLALEYTKMGMGEVEITTKLHCHPFVAKKSVTSAKRFTREKLLRYISEFHTADVLFKTGKAKPLFAIESALFQLV
jgi:DNA polymerase III subunit delta